MLCKSGSTGGAHLPRPNMATSVLHVALTLVASSALFAFYQLRSF